MGDVDAGGMKRAILAGRLTTAHVTGCIGWHNRPNGCSRSAHVSSAAAPAVHPKCRCRWAAHETRTCDALYDVLQFLSARPPWLTPLLLLLLLAQAAALAHRCCFMLHILDHHL